jgi:alpha-L-fucosidase 2
LNQAEVKNLVIESEKGRDLALQNPWPGRALQVYRNGHEAEHAAGEIVKLKTSPGERIEVRPQ